MSEYDALLDAPAKTSEYDALLLKPSEYDSLLSEPSPSGQSDGSEIKAERGLGIWERIKRFTSPITGPTASQRIEESVPFGKNPDGSVKYEYKPLGDEVTKRGLIPAITEAGSAMLDAPTMLSLQAQGKGNTISDVEAERQKQMIPADANDDKLTAVSKAVHNSVLSLSHTVANPATLLLPNSRLLSAGFAVDMLGGVKDQVKQAIAAPTTQEKIEGWVGAIIGLGFGALAATHAGLGGAKVEQIPKEETTKILKEAPTEALQASVDSPEISATLHPEIQAQIQAELIARQEKEAAASGEATPANSVINQSARVTPAPDAKPEISLPTESAPPTEAGQSNLSADVKKNISDANMMAPDDPAGFLKKMADSARSKGKEEAATNFEAAITELQKPSVETGSGAPPTTKSTVTINFENGISAKIDPKSEDITYTNSKGERVGKFESTELPGGIIGVELNFLADEARGKGIGQASIERLAELTGKPIASDQFPSDSADSMWRRLGAKKEPIDLGDGEIQLRYVYRPKTKPKTTPEASAAPAGEPGTSQPGATGLTEDFVNAERAKRGEEPVSKEKPITNKETLAQGRAAIQQNPARPREVIERLRSASPTERTISREDAAVLLAEKRRLVTERNAAGDRAVDEKLTPEERAVAKQDWESLEGKVQEMDQAAQDARSVWGGFGQFWQRTLREDFSFENLERRARVAKDGPLTPEESGKLKEQAERIAELEKKVEESQSSVDKASEDSSVAAAIEKDTKDIAKQKTKPRKKDAFESALDKAIKALSEKGELFADPLLIKTVGKPLLRGALQVVRAAYKGGKALAEAVADGIAHLRKGAKDLDEAKAKDFFDSIFASVKPEKTVFGVNARAKSDALVGEALSPKVVTDLVRAHIDAGVHGESAVMKAVHADLQKLYPELTERDVRRMYVDYGKVRFPSKEETATEMRELTQLVKIQEDIDRMTKDNADPLRKGYQRDRASQAIRDKIKERNELLKKREGPPSPEKLATRDQAKQTALKNAIEDLNRELETGEKRTKSSTSPDSIETERLRAERDAMKEKLKEIQDAEKPVKSEEEKYNETTAKNLKRQLDAVRKRIAQSDFAPRVKKIQPKLNNANLDTKALLAKAKLEVQKGEHAWRQSNRTVGRKIYDGIQKSRGAVVNIASSFDLSAPRQALTAILSNVGRLATSPAEASKMLGRPFVEMVKSLRSERNAARIDQAIKDRPNAKSGADKIAGIEYSELEANTFSKFEENAHSVLDEWASLPLKTGNLAKTAATALPKLGARGVRISNRAFITFLNKTRADLFDHLLDVNFRDRPPTTTELQIIGNLVNIATGRGKMKPITSRVASEVIWAPKLLASRIQLITGQPLWTGTGKGSARARTIVAKEYARIIAGGIALYGVSRLFDEKKEDDPTSSDFGKIVRGNTRIDPWGGFQQVTVLEERLRQAKTKSLAGKVTDIGEDRKYGAASPFIVAARFGRSKLRPDVGIAVDLLDRLNFIGKKNTAAGVAQNLVVPLPGREIVSILKDRGLSEGAIIQAASTFGAGVSVYNDDEKEKPTR